MNTFNAHDIASLLFQTNSSEFTISSISIMLATVSIIGIYIFVVYRLIAKKNFYSDSFAVSLVSIAIITSIIILAVKSSIVISLGMVGALSIVRFRTPIKEPMDLVFIFWSIAAGIICGANLYLLAIFGSVVLTVVMIIMQFIPRVSSTLIMVINANGTIDESSVFEKIKPYLKSYSIRSRNICKDNTDIIAEVKVIKNKEQEMINSIIKLENIENVQLMSHDGEIAV